MNKIIEALRYIVKGTPTCTDVHVDVPIGIDNKKKEIEKIENDYAMICQKLQEIIDSQAKNSVKEAKSEIKDTVTTDENDSEVYRSEAF